MCILNAVCAFSIHHFVLDSVAFLLRLIVSYRLVLILTFLYWNLFAHLLWLDVSALLKYNSGVVLLDIVADLRWDKAVGLFQLILLILSIGNRFICAVLLGDLVALLSKFFFSTSHQTLLVTIHIGAFLCGDFLALFLVHSVAVLFVFDEALLLLLENNKTNK